MDTKESALLLISQLSKVETEAVYLVSKLSDQGDKAEAIARALGASEGEITEAIDRGVDEARRVGE